jgi:hypothetical protein
VLGYMYTGVPMSRFLQHISMEHDVRPGIFRIVNYKINILIFGFSSSPCTVASYDET